MSRILVLSHFFPPIHNVQSRINLATVYAILDAGLSPIIVTSQPTMAGSPQRHVDFKGNLKVYRYSSSTRNAPIHRLLAKLKLPPDQNIFAGVFSPMYKAAVTAVQDYTPDLIYSISMPGDAHRVAAKISTRLNVPWVAEFQDPWLENITLNSWMKGNSLFPYYSLWRKRTTHLLKYVLRKANLIVTESDGHRHELVVKAKKWDIDKNKIMRSYLGTDSRIINDPHKPSTLEFLEHSDIPKFGFVGKIYYGYEQRARRLVRSLTILEEEGIKFLFITVGCPLLPRIAAEEGLTSILPIYPISYSQAMRIVEILDWGITIPSTDININSKLFDYLLHQVPILVWGCPNGDMAKVVRHYNCGVSIDANDETQAIHILRSCITNRIKPYVPSKSKAWFARKTAFQPIIKQMRELIGQDSSLELVRN